MKSTHACASMAPASTALSAGAQTRATGLWEHAFGMKSVGSSVKFCPTAEQAARPAGPRAIENGSLQAERRSGDTVRFKFERTRAKAASGEGETSCLNGKACTGPTRTTTRIKGVPQQIGMQLTGKWLAADCGDVKPRAMPAK